MTATLIILRDPAGILGREVHALHADAPLQLQIEAAMPGGGAECELLINGERADPFTDERLDMPPQCGDTVVVAQRPSGLDPVTIAIIAGIVLAVASYALIPKLPDTPTATDSPNNRLTGQSNVARAYQAIPDVYGRRRVWPDLIQPSSAVYVDNVKFVTEWLCVSRGRGDVSAVNFADTPLSQIEGSTYDIFSPAATPNTYAEQNTTTVTNLVETFASPEVDGQELTDAIPPALVPLEGAIVLTSAGTTTWSITVDDVAGLADLKALAPTGVASVEMQYIWTRDDGDGSITSFVYLSAGCTVSSFSVTSGRATFNFVGPVVLASGTQNLGSVEGTFLSIVAAAPTTEAAGPFTLPADANRIRWNIAFLRGLQGSVQIETEWWRINSSGVEVGGTRQTTTRTYTRATYDQQFFSEEVTPSGGLGRYRVQFRRLTADLANGADVAKLEGLFAARFYATKTFPGVTIIRVTTRATESATSLRERKFNCIWQRHVRTLASTTVSASRNFARAMAHLWAISGQPIGELDTAALAAINTALGETSALLRFDGSLDDAEVSIEERMQLISNHARCIFWRDGTKWTATRDQARTTPELQLDYRNLAGSADSTVNESFHLPGSRDGVEVEYVDETTGTKKAYVRLNITSGAPVAGAVANPEKIVLPGCTTAAQATNRAQLEARKLLYQRTSVSDTALGDAQQLGPGSLVRWVDPNDFAGDDGLQAGEVMGIAGSVATLSEPPDFKGQTSGRIQFTGADGLLLGAPVVCTPVSGQPYQVTLASVPAGLYVAAPPTSQVGSRYAFAVGLTGAEVEAAGLYTVTDPKPNGDGTWSLAMVNYDARVYAAD